MGIDYFPLWRPHWITENRFSCTDFKLKYKALRNSSSAFTAKTEVREAVFLSSNFECELCGSMDNLTVDHIVSVYRAATGEFPIEKLNSKENLQALCFKCNSGKAP